MIRLSEKVRGFSDATLDLVQRQLDRGRAGPNRFGGLRKMRRHTTNADNERGRVTHLS